MRRLLLATCFLLLAGCGGPKPPSSGPNEPPPIKKNLRYKVIIEMEVISDQAPYIRNHTDGSFNFYVEGEGKGRVIRQEIVSEPLEDLPTEKPPTGEEPVIPNTTSPEPSLP